MLNYLSCLNKGYLLTYLQRVVTSLSAGGLDTRSKNNLSGITLGIRLMLGINSLTLHVLLLTGKGCTQHTHHIADSLREFGCL